MIDSRVSTEEGAHSKRRRRECPIGHRFTTYEQLRAQDCGCKRRLSGTKSLSLPASLVLEFHRNALQDSELDQSEITEAIGLMRKISDRFVSRK